MTAQTFRKITSVSIALCFFVMLTTGILSYYQDYSRVLATVHTVFGILFSIGVFCHLVNNFKPLKSYWKGSLLFIILAIFLFFLAGTFFQKEPFVSFMDLGAKLKATSANGLNHAQFEVLEMNTHKDIQLSVDLLRAEHYWHPQMAIWVEDSLGNFIETLFISKATAQGLFFGGRSKDNFKEFDEQKTGSGDYRRVDALPVWSHRRGIRYDDGLFVPPSNDPMPDAITGATFIDNFKLLTSIDQMDKFQLYLEINVAFDDNEYYSEYDFPDDDVFHNGTGQLGQPSVIFHTAIDLNNGIPYYLMNLVGHGHQSGQTGQLYTDLSTLTTAKQIVERIVVGVRQQ